MVKYAIDMHMVKYAIVLDALFVLILLSHFLNQMHYLLQ